MATGEVASEGDMRLLGRGMVRDLSGDDMDERAFWIIVRRALLSIVGAIERRYGLGTQVITGEVMERTNSSRAR
jgi:hypothetical protein